MLCLFSFIHPHRTAPPQERGTIRDRVRPDGPFAGKDKWSCAPLTYRDVLRFLRRIINITSAAPAAIQMIACNIVLLMVSHLLS